MPNLKPTASMTPAERLKLKLEIANNKGIPLGQHGNQASSGGKLHDDITDLLEEREEILDMLTKMEWVGACYADAYCLFCHAYRWNGHRDQCALHKLLRRVKRGGE